MSRSFIECGAPPGSLASARLRGKLADVAGYPLDLQSAPTVSAALTVLDHESS